MRNARGEESVLFQEVRQVHLQVKLGRGLFGAERVQAREHARFDRHVQGGRGDESRPRDLRQHGDDEANLHKCSACLGREISWQDILANEMGDGRAQRQTLANLSVQRASFLGALGTLWREYGRNPWVGFLYPRGVFPRGEKLLEMCVGDRGLQSLQHRRTRC